MPNERLRDAMLRHGMTAVTVAESIGVDPKTVERWMTQDRIPYPKHRHAIAAMVREGESYLWPGAYSAERSAAVAKSELVSIYPRRSAVPAELWQRLIDQATMQIGLLAYGGLFLHELIPNLTARLLEKAEAGAQVEVLLGDPDCEQVAQRGADEGIGYSMGAKIRNTLSFYEPMRNRYTASVMYHDTILYNSIYRFDDEMLVNTHLYGHPAAHAPIMHLRRLAGGDLFDTYAASFQRVRGRAREVWPDE
jgi:transcriptional regulator with XRE-family HTH domain